MIPQIVATVATDITPNTPSRTLSGMTISRRHTLIEEGGFPNWFLALLTRSILGGGHLRPGLGCAEPS